MKSVDCIKEQMGYSDAVGF